MKLPRFRVRSVVALLVLLSLVVLLLNPPAHHSRLLLEKVPRSAVPSSDLIFLARLEGDEEGRAGGPVQQTANTRGAAKDSKADRTNVKEPFTKNFFALDKESKGKEVIATKMTSPKSPKEESVAKISPEEDELEEKAERPMSHKEAGYVNDIYVEDYTPQDFVEVKKLHPVTSKVKAPGKKPAVASQRRPSPQSMPHTLRERALTFSNTSALWKFLKEQERRAQHVKATCQERFFPMVDLREWMHVPPRALLGAKDIIYDSANHLAFCPVYKAASTSWSITLLELGGYWRESLKKKNSLQLLLKQIFPRISNFAASSITSDCTRFMVVRHPFERLVSCYRDKFQDASKGYYYLHYGEKMVRRYRKFHDGLSQQQVRLITERVGLELE